MRAFAALVLGLSGAANAQPAPGWEVRVPERVELVAGEPGTLPIAFALDRGLAVSRDAPVIIDITGAGAAIKKTRLGRPDAVDPGADAPRFAVPVRSAATGEIAVTLRLRLWLCSSRVCRPLDVRRHTKLVVAPPTK